MVAVGLQSGKIGLVFNSGGAAFESKEKEARAVGRSKSRSMYLISGSDNISFRNKKVVEAMSPRNESDVYANQIHLAQVNSVLVDNDNQLIISCSNDKTLVCSDFQGNVVRTEKTPDGVPNNLLLLPYDETFLQNKAKNEKLNFYPPSLSKTLSRNVPKTSLLSWRSEYKHKGNNLKQDDFSFDYSVFASSLRNQCGRTEHREGQIKDGNGEQENKVTSSGEEKNAAMLREINDKLIRKIIALENSIKNK